MDLRAMATRLVAEYDAKGRRASAKDVVLLDEKAFIIADTLRDMIERRPKGKFEHIAWANPSLDDTEWLDSSSDEKEAAANYEKAFGEFDAIMNELVGKDTGWAIPLDGDNEDDAAILFTE